MTWLRYLLQKAPTFSGTGPMWWWWWCPREPGVSPHLAHSPLELQARPVTLKNNPRLLSCTTKIKTMLFGKKVQTEASA